jgi:hypothetical protein
MGHFPMNLPRSRRRGNSEGCWSVSVVGSPQSVVRVRNNSRSAEGLLHDIPRNDHGRQLVWKNPTNTSHAKIGLPHQGHKPPERNDRPALDCASFLHTGETVSKRWVGCCSAIKPSATRSTSRLQNDHVFETTKYSDHTNGSSHPTDRGLSRIHAVEPKMG